MGRRDLLSLSPQSLASLSNWGLVKRATREIEKGLGPLLEEDEQGGLSGRFQDGSVVVFTPEGSLAEASCTCGAPKVCRHRVALVLAYKAFASASGALEKTAPASQGASQKPWTPAEFSDAQLQTHVDKRAQHRARALKNTGIVVEIRPSGASAENAICEARLPMCTVLFHLPGDLLHAQCTCQQKSLCEHILLAIWAFREAKQPTRAQSIRLGPSSPGVGAGESALETLEEALKPAIDLLLLGVEKTGSEAWTRRLTQSISKLEIAGYLWPASILRELLETQKAYHLRSARYSHAERIELFSELFARARAARASERDAQPSPPVNTQETPNALTSRFVLGSDELPETPLDHVRLLSLGARILGEGEEREAMVYLADITAGLPLVLRKRFSAGKTRQIDINNLRLAPGICLGALAHGQLVSRSLRRLANHSVIIAPRSSQSSLTPYDGDYSALPPSLLIRSFGAFEKARRADIPRMLKPRFCADNIRVLEVAQVSHAAYRPGDQQIRATLLDAQGESIELIQGHHALVPHSLDTLAHVLQHPQSLRFVCGALRRAEGRTIIEPCALVSDRLIIPDLDAIEPSAGGRPSDLGVWLSTPLPHSPHRQALSLARGCLEELCHDGLMHAHPQWTKRARTIAEQLESLGLEECARRISQLGRAMTRLQDSPEGGAAQAAVQAWISASIRILLSIEAL